MLVVLGSVQTGGSCSLAPPFSITQLGHKQYVHKFPGDVQNFAGKVFIS